jgi:8-oxo-dGTP pyrophosphatase MutT (NUDIX family)
MKMQKAPYLKKQAFNGQKVFDWEYGDEKSNIALENRKLNVKFLRYYITSPDGKILYDTIAISESKTNTVVVIVNERNDIGLIREWRPVPARWFWACVRGFGDPGDKDNLATAKREMIEEIGSCRVLRSRKIGSIYQNTTFYENPIGIVLLEVQESRGEPKLESGIDELRFFPPGDVKKMISTGEIDDVLTVSALARYLAIQSTL